MSRATLRILMSVLAAAAAIAGAPAGANAAATGALAVAPPTGTLDTPMDVETDGPCSGGPLFHIFVTGQGLDPADNFITGATSIRGLGRTTNGALYAPLSVTFRQFFADHHVSSPVGTYTVTLRCRAELDLTSLGDFSGQIVIDQGGHYKAIGAAARPVAKPDDGGLLGPNNPLLAPPTGATAAPPTASAPTASAPATSNTRHHVSPLMWGLVAGIVLILSALMVLVSRRRTRTDARPDAQHEQRKVLL